MPEWKLPMTGGCRCCRVRFEISAPPMITLICHCTGCQRMTGSAYSTTVMVPTAGLNLTQGDVVIGGIRGDQGHHQHCDYCKSWIFTEIVPDMGFVNVRATMLDDTDWFTPYAETYTNEALAWARINGPTHSFATFPTAEEYQPLLAEFAAR